MTKYSPRIPKIIILAVYKTKQNDWRGFCMPYDVTCNAPTKKEVMYRLEKLVDLYDDGLKKYYYPKHLSIKKLSNKEDARILNIIIEHISDMVTQKIKEEFIKYESEQEKKYTFNLENYSGYFYHKQAVCMPAS